MKVFHVLDHSIPLHSGYSFRTLSLLRGQRGLGWETFHLTSPKHQNDGPSEEIVEGWHFYRTPGFRTAGPTGWREWRLMSFTTKRLAELVAKVKPDILHVHSPVLNAIPAIRVGRRFGIPVVYEVRAFWEDAGVDHGTHSEWGLRYRTIRALETYALRRAAHVTTICEGLRSDILARGVLPNKVTVVPNAVDIDEFARTQIADVTLKQKLGLSGSRVIGFVGSFYAYEGLDLLLQAFPMVLSIFPDTRMLLVGGGPEEAALRQQVDKSSFRDHVVFSGRVPHADVQRYYSLIDVLAYPRHSMRLTELVTPLKPLEAMAQGRVFVASDVGGHRELVHHEHTGILFRAGDASALAEALTGLLRSTDRWQELRDAGRQFVERERTWSQSVARYAPVFERLVETRAQ